MQLWHAAFWFAFGLVVYTASMPLLLGMLEYGVRAIVASRGEPIGWMHWATPFWLVAAIPLTQVLYAAAMLSALLVRHVDWRGVTYRIDGSRQVRLLRYKPFSPETKTGQQMSL
jgi:hypothetical protein